MRPPKTSSDAGDEAPLRVAHETLGIERLRPGQRAAIDSITTGRDTVLVMPTGSGKSAVYQIAGTLLPHPTVVVSPLIALQHDQVSTIASSRLEQAGAAVHLPQSALSAERLRTTIQQILTTPGELERLANATAARARPHAAEEIARRILNVIDAEQRRP